MRFTMLRVLAVVIAILAVVDPALTSSRPTRSLVAILDGGEPTLSERVGEALGRRFTIVRGMTDAASAIVIAGDAVPDELPADVPLFGVIPRTRGASLRVTHIDAPPVTQLHARTPVTVRVSAAGLNGTTIEVELQNNGVVVANSSARVTSDTGVVAVTMPVTLGAGSQMLYAVARQPDGTRVDSAATVIDVRVERVPVLFFDTRPSWQSTFVRRALENDARFAVTHRVATSRGVSNTAGNAPLNLRDATTLRDFATIVVGAPDQLTATDVGGLEAFMRRRGGRVVLLLDGRSNSALDRLSGVSAWRSSVTANPSNVTDGAGQRVLRARTLFWPSSLPAGAITDAVSTARDSTRRPVVWSVPLGAGRLVSAGVVDGWHFRDDSSGFDGFWSSAIAGYADAAPATIDVRLDHQLLKPGEASRVQVTIRDALLAGQNARASVTASIVSEADSQLVRLWPTATAGVFEGKVIAPRGVGPHRIVLSSGIERSFAVFVVDSVARRVNSEAPDLMRALASSHGGATVTDDEIDQLPRLLASAIQPVSRVETWHPMRSGWWIVPFALLLGAEWWWRRRRGLA